MQSVRIQEPMRARPPGSQLQEAADKRTCLASPLAVSDCLQEVGECPQLRWLATRIGAKCRHSSNILIILVCSQIFMGCAGGQRLEDTANHFRLDCFAEANDCW